MESRLTSSEALVDRLSTPIFLVNKTGVLRYANLLGQQALERARYLVLRDGRVRPRSARQERQFLDVVSATLLDDPSFMAGQYGSSMRLIDAEGHAAVLLAQSLRGQPNLGGMPHADVVLFLNGVNEKSPESARRMKMAFSLTAETRLAERLMGGQSLSQIGEELQVSRETLKSQLRSLFTKTDTRRQGELISRLLFSETMAMI